MKNLFLRPIRANIFKSSSAIILSGILISGCISRGAYEQDIARLTARLQQERIEHANQIASMEVKLKDRAKSLADLTDRYMTLQKEREQYQVVGLKSDLEALSKDLAELKLVVASNAKGAEANEMLMKIADMQKRINLLLEKEKNARPSTALP